MYQLHLKKHLWPPVLYVTSTTKQVQMGRQRWGLNWRNRGNGAGSPWSLSLQETEKQLCCIWVMVSGRPTLTAATPKIKSTHSHLLPLYELRWGIQELPESLQQRQPWWDQLLFVTLPQGINRPVSSHNAQNSNSSAFWMTLFLDDVYRGRNLTIFAYSDLF